jgi:hypothetical protein
MQITLNGGGSARHYNLLARRCTAAPFTATTVHSPSRPPSLLFLSVRALAKKSLRPLLEKVLIVVVEMIVCVLFGESEKGLLAHSENLAAFLLARAIVFGELS